MDVQIQQQIIWEATINDGSCVYNNSTLIWSEDFANGIPSTWSNSTAPWTI